MRYIVTSALLFHYAILQGQTDSKKVYYLDTNYVDFYEDCYYEGCKAKICDTIYSLHYDKRYLGNWQVFYDATLSNLQSESYTRNDTVFDIQYHRNGMKKSEIREVDHLWIYHAEWCGNGQAIVPPHNPNLTGFAEYSRYYCNGQKEWEGLIANGQVYGTERRWYENGGLQSEKTFTAYNQDVDWLEQGESILICEKYWDEHGNETEPFDNGLYNINMLSAPNRIDEEFLTDAVPYHQVLDNEYYDNSMSRFAKRVYEEAILPDGCACKVGQVYVRFYVEQDGSITQVEIDTSLEPMADAAFLTAIHNVGTWPAVQLNGEPVRVAVVVALSLENIQK
ncbi:MAG: hypothetical protein ACKVOR_00425 [Flavobacteriales bacterium]